MVETQIYVLEDQAKATETFRFWQTVNDFRAVMIGPTKILPIQGINTDGLDTAKEYYIVIGTNGGALADPAIDKPPE